MELFSKISKPCIFIISGGRTGTLFFAQLFNRLVPNCSAFHEPDVVARPYLRNIMEALPHFGPLHLALAKMSEFTCMRELANARQRGAIGQSRAASVVRRLRRRFLMSMPDGVYAEANGQLLGLVDVLPLVFPNSKTIILVRDGREWVKSCIRHWGGLYGLRDYMYKLGLGRLSAKMFPADKWHEAWRFFNQFQKHTWLWDKQYRYTLDKVKQNPNAAVWRYEDVFLGPERYQNLRALMDYATHFPDGTVVRYGSLDGALERKVHESRPESFPHWRDWSDTHVAQFWGICSDLMLELGYGNEPEWKDMCARAERTAL